MSDDLESGLRQLLKDVVREVAAELIDECKASARHQVPKVTPAEDGFLLTPRETAKRLAISERHLFRLTSTGQLPCVRVGKCVRYNVETIQRWVREAESTEPPSQAQRGGPSEKASAPVPTVSTSHSRKPKKSAGRKQRGPAREKVPVSEKRTSKVRQSISNGRSQKDRSEERVSPLFVLLDEIGIDRRSLPPITNGELRRIAEVDIAMMHGWQYLNRSLPEEATNRLKNHFRCLVTKRPVVE